MKPAESSQGQEQGDLYRSRLSWLLDQSHPLYVLAEAIDWQFFEREFGSLYVERKGRPGLPMRLLVGLHYLKHLYDVSDERAVAGFVENPYWQYFCGEEFFVHELPCDPTSLVKWRKRIGPGGMEKLLAETIAAAQRQQARKGTRKWRTYLGRVLRDIQRKAATSGVEVDPQLWQYLERAGRIYRQQRSDKHKLYSMQAPEVECISKGKEHKKYEFGCKVSVVTTSKRGWVVGIAALHGNP